MKMEDIISEGIQNGASDIHITEGLFPVVRVDGVLKQIEIPEFRICSREDIDEFSRMFLTKEEYEILIEKKNLDISKTFENRRLRVHAYTQMGSIAYSIRVIPMDIPALSQLRLPQSIMKCTELSEGLVLVTGITGSGKSTTLASLIDEINTHQKKHIITVEDPIEYIHPHKKSMVNQREVGSDVLSFADATTSAMREDPDILLLGELRDLDTIKNAITMAETGHLVFATLHTRSAGETPDRMVDVFPGDQQEQIRIQLANSLKVVIAQELLPKKGGGRIASCEIMFVNDAIRNIIKKQGNISEIVDSISATSKTLGSQTRLQSLAMLYNNNFIDRHTLFSDLTDNERSSISRLLV